ncbi:MAG TPA: hypothetical protein VIK86_01935 [Candidatus Paceibacterota bacterium]
MSKNASRITIVVGIILLILPPLLIYSIYGLTTLFTLKSDVGIPLILINYSDGIKISEYILAYIGILGTEITATLTFVIFYFSNKKEEKERKEKIIIARNKVYMDLNSSLHDLFKWYLSEKIEPCKAILIDENWENRLSFLDLDSKFIEIYRDLYVYILNIKKLQDVDKTFGREINQMIEDISLDFYSYYLLQIRKDIEFRDVLKDKYLNALFKLKGDEKTNIIKETRYTNGEIFYKRQNEKYIVYGRNKDKLCDCTFFDAKPYTGYAKHFISSHFYGTVLYYDGNFKDRIETEGKYFNCMIDKNNKVMLTDKKPRYGFNRLSMNEVSANNLNNMKLQDCNIADFEYLNGQYTVDEKTIKLGKFRP